jgi:hypothetical protein
VKVLVYVEGPADRDALAALLRAIIESGRGRGLEISFSKPCCSPPRTSCAGGWVRRTS